MSIILDALTTVNSFTTDDQQAPSMAVINTGGWVTTWQSYEQDGNANGIYLQRFDAAGTPTGMELKVNTVVAEEQANPTVTALNDNGWVVTWQSDTQDGEFFGIYQQRYKADGSKFGLETRVNTITAHDQTSPSIAALNDGGWVVTWQSDTQDGDGFGIYQQRYDAMSAKLGTETKVNTGVEGAQVNPTVTGLALGGWVVTWQSAEQDGYFGGIYQQHYGADGNAVGGEILVNTATAYDQSAPVITALPNGGWVVTWQTFDDDLSEYSLFQQAFTSVGVPDGVETKVNATGGGAELGQSLVAIADGGWVVIWCENGSIMQRVYDGNGVAVGGPATIGVDALYGGATTVAALPDGGWVASWQAYNEMGDLDIVQRIVHTVTNVAPSGADSTITVLEGEGYSFTRDDFGFSDGTQSDELQAIIITEISGSGYLARTVYDAELDQFVTVVIHAGESVQAADIDGMDWVQVDNSPGAAVGVIGFQVVDTGGTANGGQNTDLTANTITFDAIHVNQAPEGADKTISIATDGVVTFTADDFGFHDSDGNAFAGVVIDTVPLSGELKLNDTVVLGGHVIATADISGLTWTPPATGAGKATFAFRVMDNGSTENAGINMDVAPNAMNLVFAGHHAPEGKDFEVTTDEDMAVHFEAGQFGFVDGDGDDLAGILISAVPSTGKLKLDGDDVIAGSTITIADLGKLAWTPEKDSFGEALDFIEFQVADDGSLDNGGSNSDPVAKVLTFNVLDVVDYFVGTGRKDKLVGTSGDDLMIGRKGADTLTGGAGTDTFVFFSRDGRDKVTDFDAVGKDHDILDISAINAIRGFHDLVGNHMHQAGANVIIDNIGKGCSIKLLNVDLDDLNSGDFLF